MHACALACAYCLSGTQRRGVVGWGGGDTFGGNGGPASSGFFSTHLQNDIIDCGTLNVGKTGYVHLDERIEPFWAFR